MPEGAVTESSQSLLLVMDTCAEIASVALCDAFAVRGELMLPERTASVGLLGAIGELLRSAGVSTRDLSCFGVVSGPGSFTGVRVGLATAKGLCEANGVALAAVSRLAVLAQVAGLRNGFAVLSAGRGEVYVREERAGMAGREWLSPIDDLVLAASDGEVIFAETALAPIFSTLPNARLVAISAKDACEPVRRCLAEGGTDVGSADASYVRNEEAIYSRQLGARQLGARQLGARQLAAR